MLKSILAPFILLVFSYASFATDGEKNKQPRKYDLSKLLCSEALADLRPFNSNFRPNEEISKKFVAGGLQFFLLEVKGTDLNRFLNELEQIDSIDLPVTTLTQKEGLIPITSGYYRYWLQTPTFLKFTPMSEKELEDYPNGVPINSLISPKQSVYIIIDPQVLNMHSWSIYNYLALRGKEGRHLYSEINSKSNLSDMLSGAQDMTEMQKGYRLYRGRFVLDGPILKQHVWGFLVQPDSPELSSSLKQISKGNLGSRSVVIESNDLDPVFKFLHDQENSPRVIQTESPNKHIPGTKFKVN